MKRFLFLLLTALIISCGDLSLETDPILVHTIEDGEVLSAGDFFDISFSKTNESVIVNPTSADVKITYLDQYRGGLVLDEESDDVIVPVEFVIDIGKTPNPQFQLTSEFKEGVYSMFIEVYEDENIISEYYSEFVVFSGELSGEVLSLYPIENMYTGSRLMLEAQVYSDDYIDPYLVWSVGGDIFQEGFLSEGYNAIIWDSSDRYGFMDITLDLYPYKFTNITTGSDSPVDFSFTINPLSSDLYDDEILAHYYKLLFFNGNYIDETDKELDIYSFGEMTPSVFDEFYGMKIGPEIGFRFEESIIPYDQETGEFESFSMVLNYMAQSENDGKIFRNIHNDLDFELFVENGVLIHHFGSIDDNGVSIEITDVELNSETKLVISYVKTDSGYNIYYYSHGELLNQTEWSFDAEYMTPEEFSRSFKVGADDDFPGFEAILDEFQVYYRDDYEINNIYSHNISDSMDNVANFLILDGFNSVYNPGNLLGDGISDGETLTMLQGAELVYSELLSVDKDYTMSIYADDYSTYSIELFGDEADSIIGEFSGDSVIKRKGNTLFMDDEMIVLTEETGDSFKIISFDNAVLDILTLEVLDRVVETE